MTTRTGPISGASPPPGNDDEFFAGLVERSKTALAADTAVLLLLNHAFGYLSPAAADGLEDEVRQEVRIAAGNGFAGRIAATRQPLALGRVDHATVVNPILVAKGIRALMGVPLVAKGAVIGVLHVGSLGPRDFAGQDAELLTLIADQAAMPVLSRAAHTIDLLALASAAGHKPALHIAGPAALHSGLRHAWCPHGHWYSPGSFTVSWESCPCAGRGHYFITCRRCAAQKRQTQINMPKCWYLDF